MLVPYNTKVQRRVIVAIMAVFACMATTGAKAAKPPSILFILADDLAWSDLACYGHPWHDTPHLDDLAQQGMRFTNGYAAAPICSASRASILTGRTTARLNFEFVTKNESGFQKIEGETLLTAPPFTLNLPLQETTIPEYLRGLGYETAFFGKWHLNAHHRRYLGWSPTHGPRQQDLKWPRKISVAIRTLGEKKAPEPIETAGEFPTDSMIDRIVRVIRQRRERPLFLMASQFYVHTPVQTRCKWLLDKYERRVPRESPNREPPRRVCGFRRGVGPSRRSHTRRFRYCRTSRSDFGRVYVGQWRPSGIHRKRSAARIEVEPL